MKKFISVLPLICIFLLAGCGEKKDYEYFSNHIDEAKQTVKDCLSKEQKGQKSSLNVDECQSANQAVIEWRSKQVKKSTTGTSWN